VKAVSAVLENNMDTKQSIEQAVVAALKGLGVTDPKAALEHPGDLSHGDFSTNVALAYAKELKSNPRALAEKIVAALKGNPIAGVEAVEIAGPGFVNFRLSSSFFPGTIKAILDTKGTFGKTKLYSGETWLIEHTSPNPNKAMHLGHLRNNVTGMAVANAVEWNGAKVIRDAVDNDRGIAIAKLMWGYLKFAKKDGSTAADLPAWSANPVDWQTPADAGVRPDRFVDSLYVKGAEDFKNEAVENTVRDFVVKWEAGEPVIKKLWETVLSYAHEGQNQTLARLGNKWDFVWREHEHYQMGKDMVEAGLKKGAFKKLEDGAVLSDLEKYGLTDTILVKNDGTSLYVTQDIALTKLKRDKFKADKLAWVIGPEQALAMRQLFAICEQLGIGKVSDFIHVPYGYMSIKGQGKMSSRAGTVIYIDDVLDEAKKEVLSKMKEDFPADSKEVTAEMIAIGAVKYSILKAGRTTDTAFDFATSLEFEGDSGPYLQYSHTRAKAVVGKAKEAGIAAWDGKLPEGWKLTDLEKTMYRFPEVVERAGRELQPHYVATFLIELSSSFNNFYGNNKIVDAADPASPYKVALTEAFAAVVKNGLTILGIGIPEKM
jgi:arginyl-tRNA synthetase